MTLPTPEQMDRIEALRREKRRLVREPVTDAVETAKRFVRMAEQFGELDCLINQGECLERAKYWGKKALDTPEEPAEPEVPEPRNWTDV